jgi:hypothetical protein
MSEPLAAASARRSTACSGIAAASAGLTDEEIQLHTGMNPSTRAAEADRARATWVYYPGRDQEDEQRSECCGLEGCLVRPKHLTDVAG